MAAVSPHLPPRRDLLGIEGLTRPEAEALLDGGADWLAAEREGRGRSDRLRGRTVVNLFFEPSTRTQTSFEIAAKRLGADVINVSAKGSSMAKGESLRDTAATVDAMGPDVVVVRHASPGAAVFLSARNPGWRHQRRRRRARPSHPGAARRADLARSPRRFGGTACRHMRRPAPWPGRPLQHLPSAPLGHACAARRTADAAAN